MHPQTRNDKQSWRSWQLAEFTQKIVRQRSEAKPANLYHNEDQQAFGGAMIVHSRSRAEFVGLRQNKGGQRQVVCETLADGRVVLNILNHPGSEPKIESALHEAIEAHNIMCGLMRALTDRGIKFDFAS